MNSVGTQLSVYVMPLAANSGTSICPIKYSDSLQIDFSITH